MLSPCRSGGTMHLMNESSQYRRLTPLDRFITQADRALRAVTSTTAAARRPSPAAEGGLDDRLDDDRRTETGRLMRINHTGEVCAQALYQGQAITARSDSLRREMQQSAAEEIDHLAWCEERLQAHGAVPSRLNPLWYAGSLAIGTAAGLAGDRWSLGFLWETEEQVARHLDEHLARLPPGAEASRAVLTAMREEELAHGRKARDAGAAELPAPVKGAMGLASRVMKGVAYWV